MERLSLLLGLSDSGQLAEMHQAAVAAAIEQERTSREAIWTESIAVGSEAFVRMIAGQIKRRKRLRPECGNNGAWYVREWAGDYSLKKQVWSQ